jgi:ribosomal protein S18 acetylase RimI-like enzyme
MGNQEKYTNSNTEEIHYRGILNLFTSPEELFLIYPSGSWPFDLSQLERLARKRSDFTVALDGSRAIGFANIYTNSSQDEYFIGNVVVAGTHRSQGIGRALIRYMCSLIFDHYTSTVYISVFTFNTTALLLYASLGFKPYHLEQRTMRNGDCTALLYMRLDSRSW